MERKEFLRSLGAGAAFALTFPCLNGCSSDTEEDLETFPEPTGVDFTIDLTASESAPLANNGGFILVKSDLGLKLTDIVVARNFLVPIGVFHVRNWIRPFGHQKNLKIFLQKTTYFIGRIFLVKK